MKTSSESSEWACPHQIHLGDHSDHLVGRAHCSWDWCYDQDVPAQLERLETLCCYRFVAAAANCVSSSSFIFQYEDLAPQLSCHFYSFSLRWWWSEEFPCIHSLCGVMFFHDITFPNWQQDITCSSMDASHYTRHVSFELKILWTSVSWVWINTIHPSIFSN